MTNEAKIVSGVVALVVLLTGTAIYFTAKSPSNSNTTALATAATNLSDAGQLARSDSYAKGDADAKVAIVEFGDFQCPFCGQSYPVVNQILQDYHGKGVQLIFRNFPLTQHLNAQIAATAAEAAGDQGKYWEMFDLIYTKQADWTGDPPASKSVASATTIFEGYAQQLGLNMDTYKAAVSSRKYNEKFSRDMADANALQVNATPTFYVNGQKIASGVDGLRAAIDAELAK